MRILHLQQLCTVHVQHHTRTLVACIVLHELKGVLLALAAPKLDPLPRAAAPGGIHLHVLCVCRGGNCCHPAGPGSRRAAPWLLAAAGGHCKQLCVRVRALCSRGSSCCPARLVPCPCMVDSRTCLPTVRNLTSSDHRRWSDAQQIGAPACQLRAGPDLHTQLCYARLLACYAPSGTPALPRMKHAWCEGRGVGSAGALHCPGSRCEQGAWSNGQQTLHTCWPNKRPCTPASKLKHSHQPS